MMAFFPPLRTLLLSLTALALSALLTGSGCTAREEPLETPLSDTPVSSSQSLALPEAQNDAEQEAFLLVEQEESAIHRGELILVNRDVPYQFPEQEFLISVCDGKSSSYFVRSTELLLAPSTLAAINAMLDDFLAQGGSKTINLVAGWRSEEMQQHLFEQSTERSGSEHARRYVALPGHSEHHTGLAADFSLYFSDGTSADFDGTGAYRWIMENAAHYGLIPRYAEEKQSLTGIAFEPWHFRYVGIPHAEKMTQLGLCLEEYIDLLRGYPFTGTHLIIDSTAGQYEVWYEQGSDVHVPIEGEYLVSGNNVDGLIVTRLRSSSP